MNVVVQTLKHNFCLNCYEAIYNPICPECIFKGFSNWILKFPKVEERIIDEIKLFILKCRIFNNISQKCIACNNYNVYICPYCFTEYLYNQLKKAKARKEILSEFLFMFNFDFEHTGYYKEGEQLGVF